MATINFGKVSRPKAAPAAADLVSLFEQLDRKATHNSLRTVQLEALRALTAQLDAKDVVLKASTGSGKTLVGLVYLEHMRRRHPGHPALYLCPTTQLVDQVVHAASQIGVTAETYGQEARPLLALEGRAILVCTYDRLFNARSTLVRDHVIPSAIVLDDVHTGVDRVRQKYTVRLPDKVFARVKQLLAQSIESCDPAVWRGITNDEADARFEVPQWIWLEQSREIENLLAESISDADEQSFSWGNIVRYTSYARLCLSGSGAELSLTIPATEENRSYANASHRLFMSASIKDGSSLIRDLGASSDALDRVIEPEGDKGAGERMVLPVSLINPSLERADIASLCSKLRDRANVVVLTSSTQQAEVWEQVGAQSRTGSNVDVAVEALKAEPSGHFFVFAQRFDGVDLPDDACRVLVIDGIPTGERLCDQIDYDRQKNTPGYNLRTVNRIEQAMGRAVRSSADFAAVLLVGPNLAAFVGRRDVKDLLEPHTREQLELGRDIADQLAQSGMHPLEAIETAVLALLERDESWKNAHRERMSSVQRSVRTTRGLTANETAALAERKAWEHAKANNHQGAVLELQTVLDKLQLHSAQRAELLAHMAAYMYRFDQGRAHEIYRSAFKLNTLLPRPPQIPDRRYARAREQAANVGSALEQFSSANAAIARVQEIRTKLAYAGRAEIVERGLQELGELLGAESSRPEKETGRGPDVLWIFDDVALCIEAKNENQNAIHKGDAEQLLLSLRWCVDTARLDVPLVVPVFATAVRVADRSEDISFGPYLMSEEVLSRIVESYSSMLTGLSFDGPLFRDVSVVNKHLSASALTGKQLVERLIRMKP